MKLAAVVGLCVGLSGIMLSGSASAAGCGGYINVWVSGCAPWDNNPRRMPGAPGYVAPRTTSPVVTQPSPPSRIVTQPNVGNRLVTDNGAGLRNGNAGLISNNRGGLISDNGLGARR
jgi:hypothetical protein